MSDLHVRGGTDVTGTPRDVPIVGGLVASAPTDAAVLDARGLTVLPGLLDLQVNGAAGVDLTAEPAPPVGGRGNAGARTASPRSRRPSSPPTPPRATARWRPSGRPTRRLGRARPLGLHFEGPLIAPVAKGAHPERWLAEPSAGLVAAWSRDSGVLMATLAPELPGALDVVAGLVGRGVVVSVGHTAADARPGRGGGGGRRHAASRTSATPCHP